MSLEEKNVKDCEEVSLIECESVDVVSRNYLRQRIKSPGQTFGGSRLWDGTRVVQL
jgi:hypothetical protein